MRDPQDAPESTEPLSGEIVRCDACPVLCRIRKGQSGACDRYANVEGKLTRLDPLVVLRKTDTAVPFLDGKPWRDDLSSVFVTGIGATTTYPDYKPAPFIVSSKAEGVDVVTVVWHGHCDEVIVIDDHITGVLTEHQAGRFLDMRPAGIAGSSSHPWLRSRVAWPTSSWQRCSTAARCAKRA
jgi:hypothetical protein